MNSLKKLMNDVLFHTMHEKSPLVFALKPGPPIAVELVTDPWDL